MSTSPSSKPTTKRKRTKESERDGEASAIVRSDKVWFEDGNVILQSGRMQFRIHKSVISRHSKVFRDMFEVPQPEGEPTTDGCQVALVMDEANDWENVLLVLYDGKYEIDHLWDSAIERLEVDLPRSLEMWDKGYSKHLPRKAGTDIIFIASSGLFDLYCGL
ncbi:hypothetical protein CPB84DRAFT_1778783 [Gymnopilus junonius]|uniref:BTB domain-containing protein n=1 Tax=Gymnopilus junonius TaxID=109634 RepID=A0A9P5NPH2_GYMJU|nr:hypothetical protein CPB84DRAFT_1778783 [Gymnopilus junonius]